MSAEADFFAQACPHGSFDCTICMGVALYNLTQENARLRRTIKGLRTQLRNLRRTASSIREEVKEDG